MRVDERGIGRLTDAPLIGAEVIKAKNVSRENPGVWVRSMQVLTVWQWLRMLVGLPVNNLEPQLLLRFDETSKTWEVKFDKRSHNIEFGLLSCQFRIERY